MTREEELTYAVQKAVRWLGDSADYYQREIAKDLQKILDRHAAQDREPEVDRG